MSKTLNNTFCTVDPTFTILDEEKLAEAMKDMMEKTKSEEGCIYYGFVRNGNKVICREAYKDGEAVNKHIENVGPLLGGALDSGVIKLESLKVHGPADQLEIAKSTTEPLGAKFYETIEGGFTNLTDMVGSEIHEDTLCTIYPLFTIVDEAKLLNEAIPEMIAKAKLEGKCLFYGFSRCGDSLFCREAYVDGAGINEHVENIGGLLGGALQSGVLKMEGISVQGPASELEIAKATTDALGAEYLTSVPGGFARYSS